MMIEDLPNSSSNPCLRPYIVFVPFDCILPVAHDKNNLKKYHLRDTLMLRLLAAHII